MFKQFKNHLVGSVPDFGRFETLDMDSVLKKVFRIRNRIQGPSGSGSRGLKKDLKC